MPNAAKPLSPQTNALDAQRVLAPAVVDASQPLPGAAADPKKPVPAPPPPPAPPTPPTSAGLPRTPRWRVTAEARSSWGGQMVTWREGDIVSEATHGSGAIARLKAAGVQLAEVVD